MVAMNTLLFRNMLKEIQRLMNSCAGGACLHPVLGGGGPGAALGHGDLYLRLLSSKGFSGHFGVPRAY